MKKPGFIIVTGISGAGKSQVIDSLEDIGYFCVDNLPISLIRQLARLQYEPGFKKDLAVGIDIREGRFLDELLDYLDNLAKNGTEAYVIFVDADNQTIVKRYHETRRKHPLSEKTSTLEEAIEIERGKLSALKTRANRVIDTSNFTPHQLRAVIAREFHPLSRQSPRLSKPDISMISFGYKYGVPEEADIVLDSRILPNPKYISSLKNLTGKDKLVIRFVMNHIVSQRFIARTVSYLRHVLRKYLGEGKDHVTICIGCTGGQHRSVVVSEKIANLLRHHKFHVTVTHRDISR